MREPVREWRAIALFFAAAYTMSWSAWSILFRHHLSHLQAAGFFLYLLAVLAPHLSAVLVAALESGASGVREFYKVVFRPLPVRWILAAIAAPVAIYLTRYALAAAFEQTAGAPVFHPAPRTLFIDLLCAHATSSAM